jgi:hypothetical protein
MIHRIAAASMLLLLLASGCGRAPAEIDLSKIDESEEADATTVEVAQISKPRFGGEIGTGLRVAQATDTKKAEPKKREALFVDWPQPAFVLVVTGQQQGYIEPCGCTGLENQKGGLARRHTFIRQTLLKEKRWPVVAFDVGNQVRRFGRQQEIKYQMTIEGLKKIGYHAIGFGPDDLKLSVGELVAAAAPADDDLKNSPFVSANVTLLDESLTNKYRILKAGTRTIGVTSVMGNEECKKIESSEIGHVPPEEALKQVWPKLATAKCDLYVLLVQGSLEESAAIAKKFPNFDIVVTGGGQGEPTFQPEKIAGTKSVMVQVGTKGMYAGAIGFFPDAPKRIRYQRVPLDDRFEDSSDMLQLLASYQDQLKEAGLDGLAVKPHPHPSGFTFVGSQTCADCHTKAFAVWKKTPHAQATESLVHPPERAAIERHHDPECLSCHVTGWNPQKFFPYKSGFESLEESKALLGSGCENCHGPGSAHAAAESGELAVNNLQRDKLRASMRLPLADAERRGIECHDTDNSPDFHVKGAFQKYWEKVKHVGKD